MLLEEACRVFDQLGRQLGCSEARTRRARPLEVQPRPCPCARGCGGRRGAPACASPSWTALVAEEELDAERRRGDRDRAQDEQARGSSRGRRTACAVTAAPRRHVLGGRRRRADGGGARPGRGAAPARAPAPADRRTQAGQMERAGDDRSGGCGRSPRSPRPRRRSVMRVSPMRISSPSSSSIAAQEALVGLAALASHDVQVPFDDCLVLGDEQRRSGIAGARSGAFGTPSSRR